MEPEFRMHAERTPNPNSLKWVLDRPLLEGGSNAHFAQPVSAGVSPLAARLFAVEGIVGVFVASDFVTVVKRDELQWTDVAEDLVAALRDFRRSGESALGPDYQAPEETGEGELVERIRSILDHEIRPAVARDGGDIRFAGYRDGVVRLHLRGSCRGCPSATMTLKLGIEQRLRAELPEVTEVVAL